MAIRIGSFVQRFRATDVGFIYWRRFKVKCLFPPLPLQPRNYRYVALARSKTLTTTVSRLLPCYVYMTYPTKVVVYA